MTISSFMVKIYCFYTFFWVSPFIYLIIFKNGFYMFHVYVVLQTIIHIKHLAKGGGKPQLNLYLI